MHNRHAVLGREPVRTRRSAVDAPRGRPRFGSGVEADETAALPCANKGTDSGHSFGGAIPIMARSAALARPAEAQIGARARPSIAARAYRQHAEGGMRSPRRPPQARLFLAHEEALEQA